MNLPRGSRKTFKHGQMHSPVTSSRRSRNALHGGGFDRTRTLADRYVRVLHYIMPRGSWMETRQLRRNDAADASTCDDAPSPIYAAPVIAHCKANSLIRYYCHARVSVLRSLGYLSPIIYPSVNYLISAFHRIKVAPHFQISPILSGQKDLRKIANCQQPAVAPALRAARYV